jgi:hypothetical protein
MPLRQIVLQFRTHAPVSTAEEYQELVDKAWHALHEMLSDETRPFYDGVSVLQQLEAEAEHTQDGIHFEVLIGLQGNSSGRMPSLSKPKLRHHVQALFGIGADILSKRVVPQLVDATHLLREGALEMAPLGDTQC